MIELEQVKLQWVVPEKIHTPPTEEISAVRRGRGEKIVSDNSKCIRTSEGGRGLTSSVGVVWMFSGMTQCASVCPTLLF